VDQEIFVCAAKIAETVLSSKEPVISDAVVVEPLWPSMTLNHKIPCHLRALYTHNLGILTFHSTHTQLWNQAHNRRRVSPFQHNSVPKKSAIRKEVRRVFCEEEDYVRGYTMQGNLFALLQAESEGITWKLYMWNLPLGLLKFALNASIDTLHTFINLKRWEKRASVNCHLCNHTTDQGRMTRRHDSVLKHIAGCLRSALESRGTVDRSVHGRHRICLVELTCTWDTDADKARDRKISRYAGHKKELSNQS
jgi:hypothetical protein